ncbi:MAG: NADPH-dependent assimilatory sulfite reductase hemoprotein subunit [Isosphaeraceae bacterium]
MATGHPKKPSKVEEIKGASDYLRGSLPEDLASDAPSISEDAGVLLKFHGSYQQDDRDLRAQYRREGKDKAYSFMVRLRLPGGRIGADQYLKADELARSQGNGTMRITTRQSFQFHGVLKGDLKRFIRAINEMSLSTLAACGDVERNVLCCPSPVQDPVRGAMYRDALRLASHLAPRASTYWDLWLDGEKVAPADWPEAGPIRVPTPGDDPSEPIYGKQYLPRKFKTAFALPDDNCTDVYANDLGFLGIVEDGSLLGYNVLVGGGMGTTPSAAKTFPAVGKALAFIDPGDLLDVAEAIVKAYRDLGDRSDRKRARLKYVIYDLGLPAFRRTVERYLGRNLADPKLTQALEVRDHMGWEEQGDGRLTLGLPIENGRIADSGGRRIATALRSFFEKYGTPARLTCGQSILLVNLEPAWKGEVDALLAEHGVPTIDRISTVRRWSMACPAFPTCGLAVTESERVMPSFIDALEVELARLGLDDERMSVRMTGCPNGCARPYNCDIGLVGRSAVKNEDGTSSAGSYTIFLGGRSQGDRLGTLFQDYVPFDRIVEAISPVLTRFRDGRREGESFGDFCDRIGVERLNPAPA